MFQRTLYASLLGVAAVAGLAGAFLPWNEVRSATEARIGLYVLGGSFALIGLVPWFWLDQQRERIRLCSALMLTAAGVLLSFSARGFADIDTLLEPPSEVGGTPQSGVYVTGVAGALSCLVSLAALLFYDPRRDRAAPNLQAAALAAFLALPGALYLSIAIWTALDLPFPRLGVLLDQRDSMTLNAVGFVPQNDFRSVDLAFAIALPALGLLLGLVSGMSTMRVWLGATASALAIVIYLLVLATKGWWASLPCRPSCLLFTDESLRPAEMFRAAAVFYAVVAGAMMLSLWAGVGIAMLVRVARGFLRGQPLPSTPA